MSTTYRVTEDGLPPFFRGEAGQWDAPYCDYLLADDSGDACDGLPAYLVHWTPEPKYDGGTLPVSGVCQEHVVEVDRARVFQVATHPDYLRERRTS